jgi:hypothetical protein
MPSQNKFLNSVLPDQILDFVAIVPHQPAAENRDRLPRNIA